MADRVEQLPSDAWRDPPKWRIESAQRRQVPDFLIIGTMRGGTTSLYRYLGEHPDITPALRKEVHFFDRYHDKGMAWYLAHFPLREETTVVGEASPSYLFHPAVPERVREAVPDAKLVALLRNPVDRAYSHYRMIVKRGAEGLSFEAAIDQERERLSQGGDPTSLPGRRYSYLSRGLYVDQLERWLSLFPRKQLLILKSEDFFRDPGPIVQQTLAHLGLRPWNAGGRKAYHRAEYPEMNPVTRARLAAYYAPFNQRLYALLDRDLGWEHE